MNKEEQEVMQQLKDQHVEGSCTGRRILQLAPNTVVGLACGLGEDEHLQMHRTMQIVDDVQILFSWEGEFKS